MDLYFGFKARLATKSFSLLTFFADSKRGFWSFRFFSREPCFALKTYNEIECDCSQRFPLKGFSSCSRRKRPSHELDTKKLTRGVLTLTFHIFKKLHVFCLTLSGFLELFTIAKKPWEFLIFKIEDQSSFVKGLNLLSRSFVKILRIFRELLQLIPPQYIQVLFFITIQQENYTASGGPFPKINKHAVLTGVEFFPPTRRTSCRWLSNTLMNSRNGLHPLLEASSQTKRSTYSPLNASQYFSNSEPFVLLIKHTKNMVLHDRASRCTSAKFVPIGVLEWTSQYLFLRSNT